MLPVQGETTATTVPKLLEKAKLSFVLALRQAFASSLTDPSLKYSEVASETRIKVFSSHPLTIEFLPCLVISATSGDASFTYLQEDYIGSTQEGDMLDYSGRVTFTLSIAVLAGKTVERERILDHLIFFVRHLFRDVFHGFDLEYTKDISISGESVSEVDNKPVHEQTMSIPCYMEYNVAVDQSAIQRVRSIIDHQIDVELYYDDVVSTMNFLGDSATAPATTINGAMYYNTSVDPAPPPGGPFPPLVGSRYHYYVDGAWLKLSDKPRATGDQIVVSSAQLVAGDDVATHENMIARWDGAKWVYVQPKAGDTVKVSTGYNSQKIFKYDGAAWIRVY